MKFVYHGKWRDLSDIVVLWPGGYERIEPNTVCFQFKNKSEMPSYVSECDKGGMLQCVFRK